MTGTNDHKIKGRCTFDYGGEIDSTDVGFKECVQEDFPDVKRKKLSGFFSLLGKIT